MPTDDILIRFRTDTGQLKAEFDELQASLKKVEQQEKKSSDQSKVTSKEIAEAGKRRNALLAAEINVLKQLEQQQKKAFTPKDIKEFNDRISQSQKNISLLKGEGDKLTQGNSVLGSSFAKLGGLIAAAFSVGQIIAFGNHAVDEFAKAEKAAFQLLGALNGNEAAQKRLLSLADEFQARFAIDNDVIVAQESFLAIQGRTETQIRKTIQAAIQLSAVTGEDLASAVQKLDGTFEGVTGRLGRLDSRISGLTKTQLANGEAIDIINEKYEGLAEKGLAGVSGELQRIEVESENAAERLGKSIAPIKIFFQDAKKDILNFFSTIVDGIKSFAGLSTADDEITKFKNEQLALSLKAFENFSKEKLERLQAADERELASSKNLTDKQKVLIQSEIDAIKQLILIKEQDAEASRKASLPTDEELKAIREKAAKELDARKQSTEALKKFTLQSLQDGITDEESLLKVQAAETINNKQQLENRLTEIELEGLEKRRALLIEFGESTSGIDKQIADKRVAIKQKGFEDEGKQRDAHIQEYIDWNEKQVEIALETEAHKQEAILDTIDKIGQSAQAFTDLLNAGTESQIQALTDAQQRQADSFDEQEEHLEELLDKHKISQDEFEKRSKTLSEQRAKNEKISQDKIKALQLEEAKRNKALAIFEATLNLAKAISVALSAAPPPFNAALAAISAVLAGVQLAAVIATPIPAFKKGTKAKQGSGLARVGEEGEEIVFLPTGAKVLPAQKTKQYADVLDSMFDGNLDKFIHKNYVLPALKLQSPNVNINIDYKKLAKANKQRDSISIDNLHELKDMFDFNPRRVI